MHHTRTRTRQITLGTLLASVVGFCFAFGLFRWSLADADNAGRDILAVFASVLCVASMGVAVGRFIAGTKEGSVAGAICGGLLCVLGLFVAAVATL